MPEQPEQHGATDPDLMVYTSAIDDLFQQFQKTPASQWGQLLNQLDDIREGIEQRIDAWMTLDEQIDELLETAVLNDGAADDPWDPPVELQESSFEPSSDIPDILIAPTQPRQVSEEEHVEKGPPETGAASVSEWHPDIDGNNISGSLRRAIGFYDLWLFEEASSLFAEILQEQPDNTLAVLFYAAAETAQGRFSTIIPQLERIRQSSQIKFRAAADEISAAGYFNEGKIADAIESLLRVVQWQPDNEDAWFNLGICYVKLQDWTAAAGALSQVLDMNKEDVQAQELLIDIWDNLEEYDAALDLATQALAQRPGHTGFLQRRGRVLQHLGRVAESIQMYQQLLLQNPYDPAVYNEYAAVCLKAGELDRAAAVLEKSLSLQPDRTDHKEKLAVVFLLQHRAEQAFRVLQSIHEAADTSLIYTLAMAQYEWQRGQIQKSLTLVEGVMHEPASEFKNLAAHYYKQILTEAEQNSGSVNAIQNLNIR